MTRYIRSTLFASFIAGVVSLAFLMPVTLHLRLPSAVGPVAKFFCPETGLFAPQYFSSRSSGYDPSQLVACLDSNGQRIESRGRHTQIVWSIAGFWFVLLFPLILSFGGQVLRQGRR